jgi:hypothetical protein
VEKWPWHWHYTLALSEVWNPVLLVKIRITKAFAFGCVLGLERAKNSRLRGRR